MELPQDAAALMSLAHNKNGFTGADIRPWHMRGRYHFYKEDKIDYEGQYEEWWSSPTQYKLTFSSPKFTQTDYATGTTLLRESEQEWPGGPELLLRTSLIDPLPDAGLLANFKLRRGSRSVGQARLECVTLTYKTRIGPGTPEFPSACFESSMPVLRIFGYGSGLSIWYDHIVLVQGHYIAHQIQVRVGTNLIADLNIESIEELHQPPETTISPPPSALPVDPSKIVLNRKRSLLWPWPLIAAWPEFAPNEPASAQENGTISTGSPAARTIWDNQDMPQEARARLNAPKIAQGTVVVKVRIRPDGHVESAEIVSGTVRLQDPALIAARQWVFRPFVVMGEARPFEAELSFGVNWVAPSANK
jgi:TonB family protein